MKALTVFIIFLWEGLTDITKNHDMFFEGQRAERVKGNSDLLGLKFVSLLVNCVYYLN